MNVSGKHVQHFRPTARGVLSLLIFCFFGFQVSSQNLVPNGSFEEGVNCPTFVGNVTLECVDWYASLISNGANDPTPDWFHECSEFDVLSPPEIAFGFQEPFDGSGYVGVAAYTPNVSEYREIIGIELTEPMIIGNSYLVSFNITSSLQSPQAVETNRFGYNLSTNPYYHTSTFPLNESHFSIDSIIPLSNDWTLVAAEFVADSNYTHFHLGNFYDDLNTDTLLSGFSSYYLIDDVNISSVLNIDDEKQLEFSVFPNPARDIIQFKINEPLNDLVNIRIYNILGTKVYEKLAFILDESFGMDISQFAKGTYIIQLTKSNSMFYERFIKY